MYPSVSVIIPVYNREATIMRAINSVLQQTYASLEVIVVDDGSVDATVETVRVCKDSRLRLICLPGNRGSNAARNRGIQEAKGKYIAFQDSDDEWVEDKLEKQICYMEHNGKEASYSPYYLHEDNKVRVVPKDYKDRNVCEARIADTLRVTNVVGTPTLVVKRELFSGTGLFDEGLKCLQDYEFVLRLIRQTDLGYIDEPLVHAYRMEKSITGNKKARMEAYVKILEKHSGFVDLEVTIYDYLKNAQEVWGDNINWQEFDQVVAAAKKGDDYLREERCFKLAAQYFNKQRYGKQKLLDDWYQFFKCHIHTGEFAIYGAGFWGNTVYLELKKENLAPRCFLVTKQHEETEIDGIPLKSLEHYRDSELPVIVAVSWENQGELIGNLLEQGIRHFCVYPYC